jgi:hypothetical protein
MTPSLPNAFAASNLTPYRSLAAALSPMHASLARTEYGWSLSLAPMRAVQVVSTWSATSDEAASTLLYDLDQSSWVDGAEPLGLASIAERMSIEPIEAFGDDQVIVGDVALRELVGLLQPKRLRAVRVSGPVERADAQAMIDATERGESPLQYELRASAAATIDRDRRVRADVRDRADALALVAENFRQYLAAVLGRPADGFHVPQLWQLERLLSLSGVLTVRPIETEIYSTSIDVGISTQASGEARPADRSLIYDLPSGTWHDED